MACNCKRVTKLEEEFGVNEEVTWFGKTIRYTVKTILLLIVFIIAAIILPFYFAKIMFKSFYGNDVIIPLPKVLSKYLKDVDDNGQKL